MSSTPNLKFDNTAEFAEYVEKMREANPNKSITQIMDRLANKWATIKWMDINTYDAQHQWRWESVISFIENKEKTNNSWSYDSLNEFDKLTGNFWKENDDSKVNNDDYYLLTNEESKKEYWDTWEYAKEWPNANKTMSTLNTLVMWWKSLWNKTIKVRPTNTETLWADRAIETTVKNAAQQLIKEFPWKSKAWYQKMLPQVVKWLKWAAKFVWQHAPSIIAWAITAVDTNNALKNWTLRTAKAEWDDSLLWALKDAWRWAYSAIDNEILFWVLPDWDAVYNTDPEKAEAQAQWFDDQKKIKNTYKTLKKYDKEVSKLWADRSQAERDIIDYIVWTRNSQNANNNDTYASISKNFDYKKFKWPDWEWKQAWVYTGKNKDLKWKTLQELKDSWVNVSEFNKKWKQK